MEGKICVVTGANAGLGFESAKAFAHLGAEVIMICRSAARAEIAREKIIGETGNERIHLYIADLSAQEEVRRVGQAISQHVERIDVLVNNAATILSKHTLTEDGIEMQFAVNHLAYFLLTHCLLPRLLASSDGRIINVSSGNHFRGKIHFKNLNLQGNYGILKAYNQSKLANVLFTYELHRRLRNKGIHHVTVNSMDPGTNFTDIGTKNTNVFHAWAWRIRRLFVQKASEGVSCQVFLATSGTLKHVGGKYWYNSREIRSSKKSYDVQAAGVLWEVSKKLCSINDFFEPPSGA